MKAFIDADVIFKASGWQLLTIDTLIEYIHKTGNIELCCSSIDYFILSRSAIRDKGYFLEQGRTEEGFPFFSFLGIKIIMIPNEKIEKYKLLK